MRVNLKSFSNDEKLIFSGKRLSPGTSAGIRGAAIPGGLSCPLPARPLSSPHATDAPRCLPAISPLRQAASLVGGPSSSAAAVSDPGGAGSPPSSLWASSVPCASLGGVAASRWPAPAPASSRV